MSLLQWQSDSADRGLLEEYNFVNAAIVVLTLTAGSAFLMWVGERITEKGVGNGISIVLVDQYYFPYAG